MTPLRFASAFLLIFAASAMNANAADRPAVIRSAAGGAWSAPATWEGGKLPAAGEKVLIRTGHTVVYDAKSDAVLRSISISGTLTFAPDRDTTLNVGLIKIQSGESTDEEGFDCEAHMSAPDPAKARAALLVGTPERPIAAGKSALIRLHFIEGMNKESCPAIVCCGGRMEFHGQPMARTWVKLGATVAPGKSGGVSEITLAEAVPGWSVGDRIIVTTSDAKDYGKGGTEEAKIVRVNGVKLALDKPLQFSHSGEGEYRAEVANLSRNVVVESAQPDGIRGHTMYHRHSIGSISYAEFRHLGKRDILGRYSLHYHLCGDTMRGASVVGASIWDSHNRWITIHGTQYLVVRDCVGYKSVGHGFFLEDGTEVYNVLDRNLACQALEGKPLPKQMLPFDKNDGAGFWFANAHNTFTRNVGVECGQYGFRLDAQPKNGVIVDKARFGEPNQPFDLRLAIRQPDGTTKPVDLRTLPFVRFEGNESHSNGKWGLNLGQHSGGKVGPAPDAPLVIRDMKIWSVVGGFGVELPHVLIDGMTIHQALYGVRESRYIAQDYRNVTIQTRAGVSVSTLDQYLNVKSANGNSRVRQPGWPKGNGDGGATLQPAEVEVAKLTPVDQLPPHTIITSVTVDGANLIVRGTASDDGDVKGVTVNGVAAKLIQRNFAQWEAIVPRAETVTAHAEDKAGNVEKTKHIWTQMR